VASVHGEESADSSQRVQGPQLNARATTAKVILFDRRLGRRVAFATRARLQWPGQDVAWSTVNLSMRGVRCDLPLTVAPESVPVAGSAVRLTLNLEGTLAVLQARVGWCRLEPSGPTLGLSFEMLRDTHEALLESVVLAGSPV